MPETVDGKVGQVKATEVPLLRAAYSDRTAALMANLADLAYAFPPEAAKPGPAVDLPPAFSALGFEKVTWFHTAAVDGWAYVAEGPSLIVVAFRGTRSKINWLTNFHVHMRNPLDSTSPLRVHEGFLQAFKDLDVGETGLSTKIKSLPKGVPIYFCGHSLGGALAQIAAAVFSSDQVAACYTFGSPRVGNRDFDLWVKVPSYRVMNGSDLVPQIPWIGSLLPFLRYEHSGDARYLPDDASTSAFRYSPSVFRRLLQVVIGLSELIKTRSIIGIADHSIKLYASKLALIAGARQQGRDRP